VVGWASDGFLRWEEVVVVVVCADAPEAAGVLVEGFREAFDDAGGCLGLEDTGPVIVGDGGSDSFSVPDFVPDGRNIDCGLGFFTSPVIRFAAVRSSESVPVVAPFCLDVCGGAVPPAIERVRICRAVAVDAVAVGGVVPLPGFV